jgi:hypothetical protein
MEIPPFLRTIDIPDTENFLRTRLGNTVVNWPDQAIRLLGYMCQPNDEAARQNLMGIVRSWPDHSGQGEPPFPHKLRQIRADWLKVADIFHVYCDLIGGQHQERRGGPSIGKAITLVAATAKSWGTSPANLWKLWGTYKDVAHLVTAATLICAEASRSAARTVGTERDTDHSVPDDVADARLRPRCGHAVRTLRSSHRFPCAHRAGT